MDRYKLKNLFLKLALFLTLGVNSLPSWAYNQMCHSPVQLAALLSPNKPKLSKGEKLRKKIKAYEKKREALEVRMDEQEDNLGDSLDKDKLKDDPYSVASEIRNYIENKQNGWPCVQDGTTKSIHYKDKVTFLKDFPIELFTRNFLLKMNVLDLLVPSAYAEVVPEDTLLRGPTEDATDTPATENLRLPSEDATETTSQNQSTNEKSSSEEDTGSSQEETTPSAPVKIAQDPCTGERVEGECVCPVGYGWEEKKCVECSTKKGQWSYESGPNQPCVCNPPYKEDGKNCREQTCTEKGLIDTGDGTCKSQDEIDKEDCENTPNKEWIDGTCVCKPKHAKEGDDCVKCSEKGENWKFQGIHKPCQCPASHLKVGKTCRTCPLDTHKVNKEECTIKEAEDICRDYGGHWVPENPPGEKCPCPAGKTQGEDGKCRDKTAQELCEEQDDKSWVGECVDCPKWKEHSAFEDDGEVDGSFCDTYASDTRACKNALSKLSRLMITLDKYQEAIDKLEDQLLGLDDSEDTKTQAGGLCFDCLKRELKANRHTPGQMIGNFSKMLAGVGLSMVGYSAGQSAQTNANMLRVQQGYPAENDMYSLQGATAGFPFIANGLYGATRTNTPVGGWSCTPSVNPYGHTHAHYAHGQGRIMPYY